MQTMKIRKTAFLLGAGMVLGLLTAGALPAQAGMCKKSVEKERFEENQFREPCQSYREVPEGFVKKGCEIVRADKDMKASKPAQVVSDYTLFFEFDSAAINPDGRKILEQVAHEIKKYKPREVTVAGYADKAGPQDYNAALSRKRSEAVSQALTTLGIDNRVIEKQAYGETRPAVKTPDGVRELRNRRVVIEFRK